MSSGAWDSVLFLQEALAQESRCKLSILFIFGQEYDSSETLRTKPEPSQTNTYIFTTVKVSAKIEALGSLEECSSGFDSSLVCL